MMMFGQIREPATRSIALIDGNPQRREMFALMMGTRAFSVAARFGSVEEALVSGDLPPLTLLHVDSADAASLGWIARLRAEAQTAILVLIEQADAPEIEALIASGADQVLTVGLQPDRFTTGAAAALGAYRQRQDRDRALASAEQSLADAKRIYRAKAILIARHGIGEQEAHRRIQKMSMQRNVPLGEMARQIVDAEDLLC